MGVWREIIDDFQWYRRMPATRGVLREPGFWICAVHRLGAHARVNHIPALGQLERLAYLFGKFLVLTVTGADLRSGARIGRRFTFHTSQGIVIADDVRIGDDCVINTGVCIVHKANGRGEGVATLGDQVWISVGAKIVGAVKIGDDVMIGANAVVTKDIPSNSLAVGIPAVAKAKN